MLFFALDSDVIYEKVSSEENTIGNIEKIFIPLSILYTYLLFTVTRTLFFTGSLSIAWKIKKKFYISVEF